MTGLFTLEDLRDCARRELAMRQRVYPRWVKEGRYTGDRAMREIALMEGLVDLLVKLIEVQNAPWPPQEG